MQADPIDTLNEPLCIKFAAELIEMVMRVKDNREKAAPIFGQEQRPEDIQYFIHASGIKEFLKKCQGNIRLYLGLSVGQYYHEGAHAASQVACLQNIRDLYEQWLQAYITKNAKNVDKVKHKWSAAPINADTANALNKFPTEEVDLDIRDGQCIRMLQCEKLKEYEGVFVEKGLELEALYRQLFATDAQDHQKDVKITLELKDPVRWGNLKQHYTDPLFVQMVNYLEACFKYGIRRIVEASGDNKKFPKEVEANRKKGLYNNWANVVKVNDLSYVIGEIIMLQYKIFKDVALIGEDEHIFLMYPGPLNMVLGSGKNVLAVRFAEHLTKTPCSYLRCEQLGAVDGGEDNLPPFIGKLSAQCTRLLPSPSQRRTCLQFIETEVGKARALEVTLQALYSRERRKEVKAKREAKRRRDKFDTSVYAQFLDGAASEYMQCSPMIARICSTGELQWDIADPIRAMVNFFTTCLVTNENVDSPRLQRSMSLTGSNDGLCSSVVEQLLVSLEQLHVKFCANHSNEKRTGYLLRAACHLVERAVAVQENSGGGHLQMKRTKSIPEASQYGINSPFMLTLEQSQKTIPAACVTVIRPSLNDRIMAGILFFIHHITSTPHVNLSKLKNPDYYPDDTPQIDYKSTQDSQNPSVASLSQSM